MNMDGAGKTEDRLGAVIVGIALVVSMFATAALAYVDAASATQLSRSRQYVTDVPQAGVLLGHNALDHSEWAPANDAKVVLFGIAAAGQPGDIEFWRDIALRSGKAAPDVRFVGVCVTANSCSPPLAAEGALTLLTGMDPVEMRAVAMAVRRGGALLYLGSTLYGQPTMKGDRQAFATEIAGIFNRPVGSQTKAGGA